MIDFIMEYEKAKGIVKEEGWDGFLEHFEEAFDCSFFSCSTYWPDDSKYICKLKGMKGDKIVGWKGIHDHD